MKERYYSGKMTVNWSNIDYVEVQKEEDEFIIYFLYRPKIKTEKLKILKKFKDANSMRAFFYKNNFFELDHYFINVDNYSVIQENDFCEKSKKQNVTLYMKNSQPLELKVQKAAWTAFKNSRLI